MKKKSVSNTKGSSVRENLHCSTRCCNLENNIRETKLKISLSIAWPVSALEGCDASHRWISEVPYTPPTLQLLAQVVLPASLFTSGHRWSTIIFPYALVSTLCTSASSLPVVYSNVVRMEQLLVTWGWLCCSHSDIFKGGWGRRRCCLWSVDDSLACCTSSTLTIAWCEGSRGERAGTCAEQSSVWPIRVFKGNSDYC